MQNEEMNEDYSMKTPGQQLDQLIEESGLNLAEIYDSADYDLKFTIETTNRWNIHTLVIEFVDKDGADQRYFRQVQV